uniref:Uncharacterized protein n=1 Tax=Pinctada fucata TaxID=50426 RepID=A0A194AKD8_PINFU
MGKYKLTYFNARGFAEVSRIILKLNGQDFEDVRVDSETWPKMKQDTPQGKLPVLEVDGKKIPQSSAIYRYLAGEFDLYGDDKEDKLKIDIIIATIEDLWPPMIKIAFGENEEIKNAAKKKMEEEVIPYVMEYLTKELKNNTNGWLVGKRMTLADLIFFTATDQVAVGFPDFIEKYQELKTLKNKISEVPQIKAWLEKRPVTVH